LDSVTHWPPLALDLSLRSAFRQKHEQLGILGEVPPV
jgi:hypothetical protein